MNIEEYGYYIVHLWMHFQTIFIAYRYTENNIP